jgi:hypothetical protein
MNERPTKATIGKTDGRVASPEWTVGALPQSRISELRERAMHTALTPAVQEHG